MKEQELKLYHNKLLQPSKKRAISQQQFRQALAGYLFITPNFLGFLALAIVPIIATIALSFSDWDLVNPIKWVGGLIIRIFFPLLPPGLL
ncbi:MAG: hypothetical protein ACM3X9_12365 [Bacillota bacterium]